MANTFHDTYWIVTIFSTFLCQRYRSNHTGCWNIL